MNWYKIAKQNKEYMLEKGVLLDDNLKPIFKIMDLVNYSIPKFKTAEEANKFLEELEIKTKRNFGRVPSNLQIENLKYRDTAKDREIAKMQESDQRKEELRSKLSIDDIPKPQPTTNYPTENKRKYLERLRNQPHQPHQPHQPNQ